MSDINNECSDVFAHLLNENDVCSRIEQSIHDTGYIKSNDGCMIIYLRGFKDAVLNHSEEIIEFLSMLGDI